jgi:hypothetical protein
MTVFGSLKIETGICSNCFNDCYFAIVMAAPIAVDPKVTMNPNSSSPDARPLRRGTMRWQMVWNCDHWRHIRGLSIAPAKR